MSSSPEHQNPIRSRKAREYKPGQFRAGEHRTKERAAGPCEGPDCSNVVPAGTVPENVIHRFCSDLCRGRYHTSGNQTLNGPCAYCGEQVIGRRRKKKSVSLIYCNREHMYLHQSEQAFGMDNPHRQTVERYLETDSYYNKNTLPTVNVSLARLTRFLTEIGVRTLTEVTPSIITRFIAYQRARGITNGNFIGHVSTFFNRLREEGELDMANPVIPRIHSQRGAPTEARPYKEKDLAFIEELVESSDDLALMLAFAIGKECGLRVGEVCNIRDEDVDAEKQEIFVRLPTKNGRTRRVPYHQDVATLLPLWLERRDKACGTNHLLHSRALVRFTTGTMSAHFKKLLGHHPAPADGFHFHRLRHTWATRLMNNGMELAVLKELGGWVSWNSMQKYIQVLDSTVQKQYQESYRRMQEREASGDFETISLIDFAAMNLAVETSAVNPAT